MAQLSQTPSETPIQAKFRELQSYDYEDDADSSVNIVAQPGAIVHVQAEKASELPLLPKPKWVKVLVSIVAALAGVAAVVKAAIDAFAN